ncbi:MAG TPA: photosynthetic reaction center cytochrome c subunit family protein [Blastocatellia bacterium]|nr:photosynthetic reaction center cytochrome c subunit family protein [Blastocatellia bacterium]
MLRRRHAKLMTAMLLTAAFCLITASGGAHQNTSKPDWFAGIISHNQSREQTAGQVYKNIQALKELRASELDGVMNFMCAALGVGCTYCHTNPWDSDEKTAKLAARRMILMTRAINAEHFSGNPAVTCYTCHRGQHNSVPNPPSDLATSHSEDLTIPAKPAVLPSTDDIIDRYIRAIGSDAAIQKIKTLVSRGTETTTNKMTPAATAPIEIYQTTANKMLIVRNTPRGTITEAFDGVKGWTRDARGYRELEGRELAEVIRDADLMRYANLRAAYPQMRVLSKEKLADRDAYVVGATSRDDSREKLYFDVQSGLLIRKSVAFKTAFGTIPEVTDFDDYRAVNGVKLPFTIAWSRAPFGSVKKFTEIKLNVVIDDSKFASPRK